MMNELWILIDSYHRNLKTTNMAKQKPWHYGQDIVLYVGKATNGALASVREYGEQTGRKLKLALAYDVKKKDDTAMAKRANVDILIPVDFSSHTKISKGSHSIYSCGTRCWKILRDTEPHSCAIMVRRFCETLFLKRLLRIIFLSLRVVARLRP